MIKITFFIMKWNIINDLPLPPPLPRPLKFPKWFELSRRRSSGLKTFGGSLAPGNRVAGKTKSGSNFWSRKRVHNTLLLFTGSWPLTGLSYDLFWKHKYYCKYWNDLTKLINTTLFQWWHMIHNYPSWGVFRWENKTLPPIPSKSFPSSCISSSSLITWSV